MKTCPTCASTAFDDMPICYGCLQPFNKRAQEPTFDTELPDLLDDLLIEEPYNDPR